jgi:hypothetical protein
MLSLTPFGFKCSEDFLLLFSPNKQTSLEVKQKDELKKEVLNLKTCSFDECVVLVKGGVVVDLLSIFSLCNRSLYYVVEIMEIVLKKSFIILFYCKFGEGLELRKESGDEFFSKLVPERIGDIGV